jgi:transcriptional regulator with XRE-family HTH domain
MAVRRARRSGLADHLGQNIASLRKRRNWTQSQLAERIGVDTETISRFERGATLPSLLTLERLAHALKVPLAELLTESSSRADDQATTLSAWLSDLTEPDRVFVLDIVRKLCQHFRPVRRRP